MSVRKLSVLAQLRRAAARTMAFLRPGDAERELDEELEAHLDMATDDKVRQGFSRQEARRQARIELGNLTQLREASREVRGLPWIGRSWLDAKLGLRMLRKSWGLTLVAGLAMTVVIGLAAIAFDVLTTFVDTDLPLDEGERVVALQSFSLQKSDGRGTSAEDFERWRDHLRSLQDIGAFRTVERNLQTTTTATERPAEAVTIAEVTASAFQLARVPAALGRTLVADDELADAAPVLVIGHDVWRSRFGADPEILGHRVRLDGTIFTIVGVMPEDFGFPIFHRYWTPLRSASSMPGPGSAADDLVVFARLRDGVTIERAQAELRSLGRLAPSSNPEVEEEIELRVVPYVTAFTGNVDSWMVRLVLLLFSLILIPPCINVAVLVYARTVSRQGEFAARYVLGASRANIVAQLFLEILVLAAGAGVLALVVARMVVWQVLEDMRGRGTAVPFWMDFGLSLETVLFVAGLAAFAALIAGAVPAMQATGRRMQSGLKSLGGQTQAKLGGVWTALIVLQVAFSFALLPTSVEMTWGTLRSGLLGPGFAAEQYLTAQLEMSTTGDDSATRFETRRLQLIQALEEQPGISAVSSTSHVPGEEPWERIEIDETQSVMTQNASDIEMPGTEVGSLEVGTGRLSRVNSVDETFFKVFDISALTGRLFTAGDFDPRGSDSGSTAVIVNRSFVDEVLGGGSPLGRRIRHHALGDKGSEHAGAVAAEPWLEIVGVVADLEKHSEVQTIYRPARPKRCRPSASPCASGPTLPPPLARCASSPGASTRPYA